VTDSAGDLIAQCVSYGDGSTHWGPIQEADIILGEETAVRTPIQVIDAAFATAPATCATADSTPAESGFNGILGVGYFVQDCGPTCASMVKNGMYYACHGLTCNKSSVPLVKQVQNPVALLPEDNNGIIVQMPDVPASGSTSVDGYLVLGIGTKTNNIPTTAETYPTDSSGYFATLFDGHLYSSFADTGSNGLFFPPPAGNILPDCANPLSAWFCPTALTNLSATNTGASGSPVGSVSFQIDNFISLISSGNEVYANIGGQNAGDFDWGLPFFLGRNVYIGIEGKSSSLGTGPYISY
jgi:hypothetical protein